MMNRLKWIGPLGAVLAVSLVAGPSYARGWNPFAGSAPKVSAQRSGSLGSSSHHSLAGSLASRSSSTRSNQRLASQRSSVSLQRQSSSVSSLGSQDSFHSAQQSSERRVNTPEQSARAKANFRRLAWKYHSLSTFKQKAVLARSARELARAESEKAVAARKAYMAAQKGIWSNRASALKLGTQSKLAWTNEKMKAAWHASMAAGNRWVVQPVVRAAKATGDYAWRKQGTARMSMQYTALRTSQVMGAAYQKTVAFAGTVARKTVSGVKAGATATRKMFYQTTAEKKQSMDDKISYLEGHGKTVNTAAKVQAAKLQESLDRKSGQVVPEADAKSANQNNLAPEVAAELASPLGSLVSGLD